jgi:hypothetical protein
MGGFYLHLAVIGVAEALMWLVQVTITTFAYHTHATSPLLALKQGCSAQLASRQPPVLPSSVATFRPIKGFSQMVFCLFGVLITERAGWASNTKWQQWDSQVSSSSRAGSNTSGGSSTHGGSGGCSNQ